MAPRVQIDTLRGSLDLLVLKTLSLTPMHGWGISRRVLQMSAGVLDVNQGSLYPSLYRLKRQGLIGSHWGVTENNRRGKYYALTTQGRATLKREEREYAKRIARWRPQRAAADRQREGRTRSSQKNRLSITSVLCSWR